MADGSVFKGDWSNNNIEGYGEYIWADGKKYVGDWKDNKFEG